MDELVITLIWGLVLFVLVFLINFFFILKRGYKNIKKRKKKKRIKDLKDFVGLSYIVPRFNLDVSKMNLNFVFLLISLTNAFIISVVFVIVYIVPWNITFRMLLGFVLLFGLIYSLYELLGRILVKKGWVKDEHKRN